MNAVDTNVFVYAFDATEARKQTQAQELLDRLVQRPGETLFLWQVAVEFLSCLRKWQSAGRFSRTEIEVDFDNALAMFPLRLPTATIFPISFDMQLRFSLSHWDSMLLAAAKEAGVAVLYSEDMDAGTDYDGITIVNPFA